MVCVGDAVTPSSSSRSNSDLEIGCLIDLATGLVTFTANGKELSTVYQVKENGTDVAGSICFLYQNFRHKPSQHLSSLHCPEDRTDLIGHQNKTI